jgi:hypothetical protein
MQEQIDAHGVQLGQEANQILKTTAETVNGPSHDDIELPLGGIPAQRIEGGAPISALGAADAVILVNPADFPSHAAGNVA